MINQNPLQGDGHQEEEGASSSTQGPPPLGHPPPTNPPQNNDNNAGDMGRPSFKFWKDMTPEERAARGRLPLRRGGHRPRFSLPPTFDFQPPQGSSILDKDWENNYTLSPTFGTEWANLKDPTILWPKGTQIHNNKMYHKHRLCVPEDLVSQMIWEFHFNSGHIGVDRTLQEIHYRYEIPPTCDIRNLVTTLREGCKVCQTSQPPHFAKEGRQEPFPVPERLMYSVSLDIFSMPLVRWEGQEYDSILLCVDRLSSWIIACPTLKQGLTADKAAHLLLEKGWEPFGVPALVHSDMGPQFVGQWFRTMCSRLGVQQTFSPPHRPRANGRAERAGQTLMSILQKLNLEKGINWVEALPRALKVHHDMVGEGGYSPYHIMFGRDRLVPGIPYIPGKGW